MDVVEAIGKRKSVRAFKPDPVSLDMLKEIVEQALRAPSWANTQPWEFAVVTGSLLKEIQEGFLEKGDEAPYPDVARPYEFPEPYMSRLQTLTPKNLEMTREEYQKFRQVQNRRNYGAPAVIYVLVDRSFFHQAQGINVWPLYDCGAVVENIMLLAAHHGLGTIAQAQAVIYPDIIRKVLGMDKSKLIALGIAVGHPDWDHAANQGRTQREPLDRVATWYGFGSKKVDG